jgi:hypothetical protein
MTGINEVLRLLSADDRAAIAVIERDRLPAAECHARFGWWTLRRLLLSLGAVDERGVGVSQQFRTAMGHTVRKVWRARFGGAAPFKALAPKIRTRRNVATAAVHAAAFKTQIAVGGTNMQAIYPPEMWAQCANIVEACLVTYRDIGDSNS